MSTTQGDWTVEGELTVSGGDATVSAGDISVSAGSVTARDYLSFGITGGYLTDGNYGWMFSDGKGVKAHMMTLMDLGGSSLYRLYVQNGNVRAMPV